MYEVKVYIVQKPDGELVGAKLTRGASWLHPSQPV
jgi:hypothetical protein